MSRNMHLVFVLLGETGSGKSTFVNLVAGKPIAKCSSDLHPCTRRVTTHHLEVADEAGNPLDIALVDTPGLNSPLKKDEKIIEEVLSYLKALDTEKFQFGGVLFFYDLQAKRNVTLKIQDSLRGLDRGVLAIIPPEDDPSYTRCKGEGTKLRDALRGRSKNGRVILDLEETRDSAIGSMREVLKGQPLQGEDALAIFREAAKSRGFRQKGRDIVSWVLSIRH